MGGVRCQKWFWMCVSFLLLFCGRCFVEGLVVTGLRTCWRGTLMQYRLHYMDLNVRSSYDVTKGSQFCSSNWHPETDPWSAKTILTVNQPISWIKQTIYRFMSWLVPDFTSATIGTSNESTIFLDLTSAILKKKSIPNHRSEQASDVMKGSNLAPEVWIEKPGRENMIADGWLRKWTFHSFLWRCYVFSFFCEHLSFFCVFFWGGRRG